MAQQPNVLILMTDQWRYDACGYNGNAICRTPVVDRLAREGMRFSHAYASAPLCTPTRASFWSGLWPSHHGVLINTHWRYSATKKQLDDDTPLLSEIFHDAGYRTAHFGKWHIGPDTEMQRRGFDHVVTRDEFRTELAGRGVRPELRDVIRRDYIIKGYPFAGITSAEGDDFFETWLCSQAEGWLRKEANGDTPFFCCISTPGPHPGYVVPQRYADLYNPADMQLWPNIDDDLSGKPAVHRLFRDKVTQAGSLSDDEWRICIARYYAFCTLIDEQFGRLLALLDELDVAENTLVLFITDHGDLIGAHRLFDKGPMMYDEQLHIPMIVRWPGVVAASSECDAMITWLDLMPTLVEASGLSLPKPVDGLSLVPMLLGNPAASDWPDDVFCQYSGEGIALYSVRGVRSRQYKYVYYPLDVDELYDLDADPWEMHNLVDDPMAAPILAEMRGRLARWMQKTEDVLYNWNVDVTPMGTQM